MANGTTQALQAELDAWCSRNFGDVKVLDLFGDGHVHAIHAESATRKGSQPRA
jgi:hypothetical protein